MTTCFKWTPLSPSELQQALVRVFSICAKHQTESGWRAQRLLLHWWMRGIQRQLHAQYHQGVV